MFCYLAHSIDIGTSNELKLEAMSALLDSGFRVYSPGSAWILPEDSMPDTNTAQQLWGANREVLMRSDLLLAVVDPSVYSFGVPVEVYTYHRPEDTIIYTNEPEILKRSYMLSAFKVNNIIGDADSLEELLVKRVKNG